MQYVGIYKPKLNNIHNLDCAEEGKGKIKL